MHNILSNVDNSDFPEIDLDDEAIIRMSYKINQNKGLAYDGIDESIFKIGRCKRK